MKRTSMIKIAAAAASGVLLTAACGSSQTPLQNCESTIKTAIDNGVQLTTGAQPPGVKAACSQLSSGDKATAISYAEVYYAQHGKKTG